MAMKKVTKQQIDNFLKCKTIAVAGVSRNEKSFSILVVQHLERLGYKVLQINPSFETCAKNQYRQVSELPSEVDGLLILTPKSGTLSVIKDAVSMGISNIWIQQTCDTPEALKFGFENMVNMVYRECIFMYTNPEGLHKFHYRVNAFFGGVVK